MNETQVNFVEPKSLTINLPSIGAPMAIRAESDEVVIFVRLTLRPRDNVMNVDLDVSASGDRAPMPSLDEDAAADVSRYWRTTIHRKNLQQNSISSFRPL